MYCKHCGKEIDDNAKYCPECGKPVAGAAPTNAESLGMDEAKPVKKKRKSIFRRWWFWVLVILLLAGRNGTSPAEPAETTPQMTEEEYKSSCSVIEYKQLARNPDNYEGQMFEFTGEVIQVVESGNSVSLRVNVTAITSEYSDWVRYEDTIYVNLQLEDGADRILEDDIITIYGVCKGSYSYNSVLGSQVTLPRIAAEYYELVG